MLYYYEGLTLSEIGDVLGVTESRACQIHTKGDPPAPRPARRARRRPGSLTPLLSPLPRAFSVS